MNILHKNFLTKSEHILWEQWITFSEPYIGVNLLNWKKLAQANNNVKDKQSQDEKQICKKIINTKINLKDGSILKNLFFI